MASGTPSAEVRIPVGDLISPPPTSAHTILLGGKYIRERQRTVGGAKVIRRLKKYPAAKKLSAQVGQKFDFFRKNFTVCKKVAQCQKYPIPYLNTLRDHSISLFVTKNTILLHCRNYLKPIIPSPISKYIAEIIPYLNALPKLYPIRRRNIPYFNTWPEDPFRPWARVGCYSLSVRVNFCLWAIELARVSKKIPRLRIGFV